MGRIKVKVLCVGYRDWALKIFKELIGINDIDIVIITSKDDLRKPLIDSVSPDIILFYGWSWMVSEEIINSYLCLCLHPSKLPKYRGGSPLQNQIINNEKISAVSIFRMTDKLDDGDICFQKEFSLSGNICEIFERIFNVGLEGTIEILEKIQQNIFLKLDLIDKQYKKVINMKSLNFVEQDSSKSMVFKRLKPEQSEITISELKNRSSFWLHNKIRMLTDPYPNAYIVCGDSKKLFISSSYVEGE